MKYNNKGLRKARIYKALTNSSIIGISFFLVFFT
jgi:hypothetical protein